MDWKIFTMTFAMIFLAELPDKTAFATLMMAARGKAAPILVGVAAAFAVQSLIAVLAGGLISMLPHLYVHLAAALMFVIFAVIFWRRQDEPEDETDEGTPTPSFWKAAASSFMVIFIAEWGDLTQLATASLVAQGQDAVTVFFAATLALWAVTGIAVFLGSHAKKYLNPLVLNKVAAVVFGLSGIYFAAHAFDLI